ncbi:MAG: hypothetical protein ACJ764_02695 [Solirubrobacteraceae bacterium]
MSVSGAPAPAPAGHPPIDMRGAHVHHHLRAGHGRLRHRLLIFFGVGFALIIGLGALGAVLGAPSSKPLCQPYKPCGPPRMERPLVNQTVWRSSKYGYSLEYPSNAVRISQQDASSVVLEADLGNGNTGTVLIQGSPAGAGPLSRAIANQLAGVSGVTQVAPDSDSTRQLFGGGVGYRPGLGRVFGGYFTAPQGVGSPVALASEAATDGTVTVSVIVGGPASEAGTRTFLYALGDEIINSVRWPTDQSSG